jgi:hypothetical protein
MRIQKPLKISGIEIPFQEDGTIDTLILQEKIGYIFQHGSKWAKIRVACNPSSAWEFLLWKPTPQNVKLFFRVLFDDARIACKILTVDLN